MSRPINELDVVRLRRSIGRWPAGTEGAVVDALPGAPGVTVEFTELIPVPERAAIAPAELVLDVALEDLDLVSRAHDRTGAASFS